MVPSQSSGSVRRMVESLKSSDGMGAGLTMQVAGFITRYPALSKYSLRIPNWLLPRCNGSKAHHSRTLSFLRRTTRAGINLKEVGRVSL